MRPVEVDEVEKSITVMFGGAWSGDFSIQLSHSSIGRVDTGALVLRVGAKVTSISPLTGSIYGGTLLTIEGENFGTVPTDNPVQISYNGGVGSTDCFVETTSATQIKCRIDSSINKSNGDSGTVVVFLKTSEEAPCDAASCIFTFTSDIPAITNSETRLEDSVYKLVLSGTGFSGSQPILILDGSL